MNHPNRAEPFSTTAPVAITPYPRAAVAGGGVRSSSLSRLSIVREMLANMEDMTFAGQLYVMGKIVACLKAQVAAGRAGAADQERFGLARSVHQLTRESQRPFPNAPRFKDHAHDVLALLVAGHAVD